MRRTVMMAAVCRKPLDQEYHGPEYRLRQKI
jgi:hypothetical protein